MEAGAWRLDGLEVGARMGWRLKRGGNFKDSVGFGSMDFGMFGSGPEADGKCRPLHQKYLARGQVLWLKPWLQNRTRKGRDVMATKIYCLARFS